MDPVYSLVPVFVLKLLEYPSLMGVEGLVVHLKPLLVLELLLIHLVMVGFTLAGCQPGPHAHAATYHTLDLVAIVDG